MDTSNSLQSFAFPEHVLPKGRRPRILNQNHITINILGSDFPQKQLTQNNSFVKSKNAESKQTFLGRTFEHKKTLVPIQRNDKKRKTLSECTMVFTTEDLSVHAENVKELFKNIAPTMFHHKDKKLDKLKTLPNISPPNKQLNQSPTYQNKSKKSTSLASQSILKSGSNFELLSIPNKHKRINSSMTICLDKINWLSSNFFKPKVSISLSH